MRSLRGAAAPRSRLRRVRAQEDETILQTGFSKPSSLSVRPPGSAGTDQAPVDRERGQRLDQAGLRTAPSIRTPAVAYFQSAISSLRARATIIVLPRRPPLRLILPVQCSDPTLANREFKSAFRDGCDRNRVSGSFSKQLIRNRNGG